MSLPLSLSLCIRLILSRSLGLRVSEYGFLPWSARSCSLRVRPLRLVFSYSVRIGEQSNTESRIVRVGDVTPGEVGPWDTPGVLACDNFTTVWVAWDARSVAFGTGSAVYTGEIGR